MKFEKPPEIIFSEESKMYEQMPISEQLKDILEGKYNFFLLESDEKYLYWDELKYKQNLPYKEAIKAWKLVKLYRIMRYQRIILNQKNFCYVLTANIQKNLHEFDLKLIGGLYKLPITTLEKESYLRNSILEEAIASSQIEGAATTTKVAFAMLTSGRKPRTESEQMILNNYRSIQIIKENLNKSLDYELVINLHSTITNKTSAEKYAGAFRNTTIYVQDYIDGEIAHIPPKATEVAAYMQDFFAFANEEERFIHPIVKASMLHFMFAYIHPFMDGNGRTARALFYWYLLKKGYSLVENISISRVILQTRTQYDKAFLKTEYDENDMTYFINYSIKNLRLAFEKLVQYRDKKKREQEQVDLLTYKLLNKDLLKRQADLIALLYAGKLGQININTYAAKNDITRQTARKDIKALLKIGLLKEEKEGRKVLVSLVSKRKVEEFVQ